MNKVVMLVIDLDIWISRVILRLTEEANFLSTLERCRTEDAREYVLKKFGKAI